MSQADAAGAAALLAFSAAASVSSLTQLPAVLVHLVMQQLPLASLARLASTCRLFRTESLHPSAGRYLGLVASHDYEVTLEKPSTDDLPPLPAYYPGREEVQAQRATNSPLGRAHLAVSVYACLPPEDPLPHLEGLSESQLVAALATHAAGWKHVKAIRFWNAEHWLTDDAVAFLQSPALQGVSNVVNVSGIWLSEKVQTAMCCLPLLSELHIGSTDERHPSLRLHPSALAQAQSLRSISIDDAGVPLYELAGLVCVPRLSQLQLGLEGHQYGRVNHAEKLVPWLTIHCRSALSQLRVLQLDNFDFTPLSRAELRRFFRAMPHLAFLRTSGFFPTIVLRGLMDAGVASLPELRVVRFGQDESGSEGGGGSLSQLRLRAFLAAFPLVRYCLAICGDGDESSYTAAKFAGWPRVCTVADHARPNIDGRCDVCPNPPTKPRGIKFNTSEFTTFDAEPPMSAAALAAEEAKGWMFFAPFDAQPYWCNSKTQQKSWHGPSESLPEIDGAEPMMSVEESLRMMQREYDADMAQFGAWVPE